MKRDSLSNLLSFVVITHAHGFNNGVRFFLRLLHATNSATLLASFGLDHLLNGTDVDLLHPVTVVLHQFLSDT